MAKNKAAATSDEPEKVIEVRNLKYEFTAVETHDLSVQLANKVQEKKAVEDELKSVKSRYKAQIDAIQQDISANSDKVASGYEFREVPCEVLFHTPDAGRKTLLRSDTNSSFVEKMTDADYNLFTQTKDDSFDENNEL